MVVQTINDKKLFKNLDKTVNHYVRTEKRANLTVKGKEMVAIKCHTDLKLISDVLYVLKLTKIFLNVDHLLEKKI